MVNKMEVIENKDRIQLAKDYELKYLNTYKHDIVQMSLNGLNKNPSIDYYIGAEKILCNVMTFFELSEDVIDINNDKVNGAVGAFIAMLGCACYNIVRMSKEKEDLKMFG